jgi:tRNA(adenine34) deaminase
VSFSEWDQRCMTLALEEARRAADRGEVPVGAVLARGEAVLAHGGNAQIELHDATAHAEIRVLREAGVRDSNYRLPGTTLYVTLEPCTMCCGALVHARVERLIFATREPRAGAVLSTSAALDNPALNHRVTWAEGLCEAESADLLRQFFQQRRGGQAEGTGGA